MRNKSLFIFLLFVTLFSYNNTSFAQGVTTSAINGIVVDNQGNPLPSATIIAIHNPSGTKYGTTAREDGRFNIANMRVGGPYTLTCTFIGYKEFAQAGIFLELSKTLTINIELSSATMQTEDVVITGNRSDIISPDRTGAAANVTSELIEDFPTISRSFQDFYKFSPQFSGSPITSSGTSAGGRNNRYNNIQIDGAVYNDLFGLSASGTPGGQSSTNPISLDAIDQFQVVIAPYDIRLGGFTGGGVNAITRSGTNEFHGSAFYYTRNQNFVGKSPDTLKTKFKEFKEYQTGFRLGGPIIKDQLFFFVNGELTKRTEPSENLSLTQGIKGAADSAAKFRNILVNKYGYDPGSFEEYTMERPSMKLFGRVDWNINEANRLSFRYNYVDASDDNLPRNVNTLLFSDRNYEFSNSTHSAVLQLNTTFSNTATNEFIAGFTSIRDKRTVNNNNPFPSVRVNLSGLTLRAGGEEFSIRNALDQDILEITDNFSYYMGDHVLTFGTHNEFFSFKNLFIQNYYGYYEFRTLADLEAGKVSRYQYSYSLDSTNRDRAAAFNVMQFGIYGQDEWTVLENLKFNIGLRVDAPFFPDQPADNPLVTKYWGLNTSKVPSGKLLFSPRLGFNYDVLNNRELQLRGGIGLFSGRVPYVWISNQFANTGVEFGRIDEQRNPPLFNANPNNQPTGTQASSEINITHPNFKMPQIGRFNLAVDYQLPYDFTASAEYVYSLSVNDIVYQDLNLMGVKSQSPIDGRNVYGDTSKGFYQIRKLDRSFTNVILLKNSTSGYSYNFSFQIQNRPTDPVYVNAGYTYGVAKDRNAGTSSRAISNYQFNPINNDPNNPGLAISNFDIKHRIFAALSYTFDISEIFDVVPGFKSTVSLFYNGQSGRPFSYTYNGDINGDGNTSNDLIYVPANAQDIILTGNNYEQFNAYIENDPYLKTMRGKTTERNGAREPWFNQIDFRFVQDVPLVLADGHGLQFSLDILNVLNLVNHDWGYVETVPNQSDNLLTFKGLNAQGKATFEFKNKTNPFQKESLLSRWQMQVGLRYIF